MTDQCTVPGTPHIVDPAVGTAVARTATVKKLPGALQHTPGLLSSTTERGYPVNLLPFTHAELKGKQIIGIRYTC